MHSLAIQDFGAIVEGAQHQQEDSMATLHRWLGTEPSLRTLPSYVVLSVFLCWLISLMGHFSGLEMARSTMNVSQAIEEEGIVTSFIRTAVTKPFTEELEYRLIPFGLMWLAWSGGKLPLSVLALVAFPTSAYFGWVHGGIANVFMHGSLGLVLAVALVKWSGNGANPAKGFLVAVLIHGTFNFCHALWRLSVAYM
jgi:hypothetical protein